jgi:hypothetical protein
VRTPPISESPESDTVTPGSSALLFRQEACRKKFNERQDER